MRTAIRISSSQRTSESLLFWNKWVAMHPGWSLASAGKSQICDRRRREHHLQRLQRSRGPARSAPHLGGHRLLVFNSVLLDSPGSPAHRAYRRLSTPLHTPPETFGEIANEARPAALLVNRLLSVVDNAQEAVAASIARRYEDPIDFAVDGRPLIPSRADAAFFIRFRLE